MSEREPVFFEDVAEEAEPEPTTESAGMGGPPTAVGSGLRDDRGDRGRWRSAPIEDLSLSMRSYNVLRRSGLITVGSIMGKTDEELLSLRNLGRKGYDDIRERLDELGIVSLDAPWDSARGVN